MLDALVTLLEVGQKRYRALLDDRNRCFEYLQQQLAMIAERYGERLLRTPDNEISCAVSLCTLGAQFQCSTHAVSTRTSVSNGALEPQPPAQSIASRTSAISIIGPVPSVQLQQPQSSSPLAPNASASVSTTVDTRSSTAFGAALFRKCVSGTRVVHPATVARFGALELRGFGSGFSQFPHAYMTAAAALGVTREEIDVFIHRLDHVFRKFYKTTSAGSSIDLPISNQNAEENDDIEP